MKTDIKEKADGYELVMDLPGFTKDEIQATLENGYLTIQAEKGLDKDEKEKETGRYIRRERYAGAMSLCQKTPSLLVHVQYRNVRSVRIRAKISPRGSAMMIIAAAANQETASVRDMIPKL